MYICRIEFQSRTLRNLNDIFRRRNNIAGNGTRMKLWNNILIRECKWFHSSDLVRMKSRRKMKYRLFLEQCLFFSELTNYSHDHTRCVTRLFKSKG